MCIFPLEIKTPLPYIYPLHILQHRGKSKKILNSSVLLFSISKLKSNFVCLFLIEDLVPGQPTNMRIRVVLGMVQVTWDPPKESHIIVRNYVLSYGKMTPGDNFITLPNTTTTYLVKNLRKYFLSNQYPGAYVSVLAEGGGGVVSKLDRLTDQSTIH